jgi:hypothetical protein
MGVINFGIPKEDVLFLKKIMSLDTFIEGGTYYGRTALHASKIFKKVFTIEKSSIIFEKTKDILKEVPNITALQGDTRSHLEKLVKENRNILYWLDSHWCGGDSYGEDDQCPLLEELAIIFNSKEETAILIDDARLFLSPPPSPNKISGWPTIKEIVNIVPKTYEVMVYEDVIYLIPKKYKIPFWEFIQDKKNREKDEGFKNSWLMKKYREFLQYLKHTKIVEFIKKVLRRN